VFLSAAQHNDFLLFSATAQAGSVSLRHDINVRHCLNSRRRCRAPRLASMFAQRTTGALEAPTTNQTQSHFPSFLQSETLIFLTFSSCVIKKSINNTYNTSDYPCNTSVYVMNEVRKKESLNCQKNSGEENTKEKYREIFVCD